MAMHSQTAVEAALLGRLFRARSLVEFRATVEELSGEMRSEIAMAESAGEAELRVEWLRGKLNAYGLVLAGLAHMRD